MIRRRTKDAKYLHHREGRKYPAESTNSAKGPCGDRPEWKKKERKKERTRPGRRRRERAPGVAQGTRDVILKGRYRKTLSERERSFLARAGYFFSLGKLCCLERQRRAAWPSLIMGPGFGASDWRAAGRERYAGGGRTRRPRGPSAAPSGELSENCDEELIQRWTLVLRPPMQGNTRASPAVLQGVASAIDEAKRENQMRPFFYLN